MFKKDRYKLVGFLLLFLLAITAVRIGWLAFSQTLNDAHAPKIQQGVLDLRGYSFSPRQTFRLDGQWMPVPDQLSENTALGYRAYRLTLLLDADKPPQPLALRVEKSIQASAVYVNGERLAQSDQRIGKQEYVLARSVPYTVFIEPAGDHMDLWIQMADGKQVGMLQEIRLGTAEAIALRSQIVVGSQMLLVIVMLVHSLYAIILGLMDRRNRALIYFFLMMILATFSVLVDDDKLLFVWVDVNPEWESRIFFFVYNAGMLIIPVLLQQLFPRHLHRGRIKIYAAVNGPCVLLLSALPASLHFIWPVFTYPFLIWTAILAGTVLRRSVREDKDVGFLLAAFLGVSINIGWSLSHYRLRFEMLHYPVDFLLAIILFSAFWFRRYFRTTAKAEQFAAKLQAEEKNKDEFLIHTSHELRNPLHGMMNIVQLLLGDRDRPLHDEHRRYLDVLQHVGSRLSSMLDDLLDITRLKANTITLQREPVRLEAVAAGVLDMARLMLDGKPVQLRSDIPTDLPPAYADENRVVQIVFNLVHNAIKFTDNGTITVRACKEEDWIRVEVADTGIGIPESKLNTIFDPYPQADGDRDRAGKGVGIGLGICRQLTELHGGKLTVRSTPGSGSVFAFTLPAATEERMALASPVPPVVDAEPEYANMRQEWLQSWRQTAAATEAAETKAASGVQEPRAEDRLASLLLVDDDSVNLAILRDILTAERYKVITATGAEQALAVLEEQPVDLVISDIMMPGVSGYTLVRRLRERFPLLDLPIVLLTARGSAEDIVAGFQAGANDFIRKPVDAWVLKARVRVLTELKLSFEERLRLEGAWLQSQIQPHFVFNTLNSIAALGAFEFDKMRALLEEFSHYLRLSFDFQNAEPVVSLERELALVRSYLYIEQERYGSRLQTIWELDEQSRFDLPPLSIQPLVENAIKHGLMCTVAGGTVVIRIRAHAAHYEVAVADDGKGITAEKLPLLLSQMGPVQPGSGVGLRNIDRRLKQLYGQGLRIESEPGQGTTVTFHIPKSR